MASDWMMHGWSELLHSMQTGKPGFEKYLGMPIFDWLAKHPEDASMFSETMVGFHGDPSRNVAHVGEHVAQVSIHDGGGDFDQLFYFDDLWAAAQPLLAGALLRYGSRWYVLSTGDSP